MMKENPNLLDGIEPIEKNFLKIRDPLYGGRTDVCAIYYAAKENEMILYVDFTSLYPYCLAHKKIAVGEPLEVIVGHSDCSQVDIESFEGLILCTVLPPKNLFHPPLPHRVNKKLMFPLCLKCAEMANQEDCTHDDEERKFTGAWVIDEVRESLRQGYKILHIAEMVRFKVVDGYFRHFVNDFYKMKLYASGYPEGYDDSNIDDFIKQVETREGMKLDKALFNKNAARRQVPKILLNSLWGKYAETPKCKTIYVENPLELVKNLNDPKVKIKSLQIINRNVVLMTTQADESLPPRNTNVVLAAYVTCMARLHLNKVLKVLGPRVLYYDTDSVCYYQDLGSERLVETGPFLGDLVDELSGPYGKGSYIEEFVSGGPKNYGYKVFNPETFERFSEAKVKGLTLDTKNSKVINFESIKKVMLDFDINEDLNSENAREKISSMVTERMQFEHMREGGIRVKKVEKKWQPVIAKRRLVGHRTIPYGYDLKNYPLNI
jgi:hypothetical protein